MDELPQLLLMPNVDEKFTVIFVVPCPDTMVAPVGTVH
jgi:hypothetical protein